MSEESESLAAADLTPREKGIAILLLYGKSRNEIAVLLGVSENTVKTHTRHIYKKAGVKNQKMFMRKYMPELTNK
ncbi:MAG: helix-turn-helix transcriptional regulator [Firmicutes bacterium]|nr:helix-turn-helix transcriptional regulator [Bacillota bacterium]